MPKKISKVIPIRIQNYILRLTKKQRNDTVDENKNFNQYLEKQKLSKTPKKTLAKKTLALEKKLRKSTGDGATQDAGEDNQNSLFEERERECQREE